MKTSAEASMQKITPFLWFDTQAEEAARFYVSLFEGSRIVGITRCGPGGPGPQGSVLTVTFELAGSRFIALNGGPRYKFTEAISLSVDCQSQQEVDDLWAKLSQGGQEQQCGWLKDRYGLSWQIIPTVLGQLLSDPDPGRSRRAIEAMLTMKKLDIARLKQAAEQA